jgi:hypothetical protein
MLVCNPQNDVASVATDAGRFASDTPQTSDAARGIKVHCGNLLRTTVQASGAGIIAQLRIRGRLRSEILSYKAQGGDESS